MFDTDGVKVSKGLLDALVARQGVLSNNLANLETEGYIRQDVDFSRVLTDLKNEVGNADTSTSIARATYKDESKPMTIESELSKLYENHLRYILMVKSVGNHYEHMKKALEVRAQ